MIPIAPRLHGTFVRSTPIGLRAMSHRARVAVVASVVLATTACASNQQSQQPSPAVVSSSVTPTPSPTPTPSTLSNGLPTSLPNGWVTEPQLDDQTDGIINTLNQEFPDANLKGAAYRDPDEPSLAKGALLFIIGEEEIDPESALYIFSTEEKKSDVGTYTRCGQGDDRVGCITETSPTVMALYFGTETFNQKTLAEFVASYQADL